MRTFKPPEELRLSQRQHARPAMLYERLYSFQQRAVEFLWNNEAAALFFDQGTGKSWVIAGLIERLIHPEFTALIVGPLSNRDTTWGELLKQLPIPVLDSWEEARKHAPPYILLSHYEALPKDRQSLVRHRWDLVVFDESQRIKARGTRQSRIAAQFRSVRRRVILSGTPIEQAPQDLWAQFRFVAPQVFGTRWADFDVQFLRPVGYLGYQREFRPGRMPEFLARIKPYIMRITRDDVLNLPGLVYHHEPVFLLGEQSRVYQDVEHDMVTHLGESRVFAQLKITQLVRLQQICSGFVVDDQQQTIVVGSAKLRRLCALIRRLPRPVVIFCKYREELRQIAWILKHRGICNVSIIDGNTRRTRSKTLSAFQAGQIGVLLCQVRTGGVGVDLYRAAHAIFYSTTFSFIDFEQAVARLHRHGQKSVVHIHLLYADNTVDKLIYEAVMSKRQVSEYVFRRLRGHNKSGGL